MSSHYMHAARMVDQVKQGKSLKKLVANTKGGVSKTQYALVMQTLKYENALDAIAKEANLMNGEKDNPYLILVMLYDLLFGKGSIQGGGSLKRELMSKSEDLIAARDLIMQGKNGIEELVDSSVTEAESLPFFVRINALKCSLQDGMDQIQSLCPNAAWDKDIPALAILPPSARKISQDSAVLSGNLIIQDKASCFPAQLLFDEWKTLNLQGDLIDACAAPGNKTSHLAALLHSHHVSLSNPTQKRATVHAFDKNPDRAEVLRRRLHQCGADNIVKVVCKDFLSVDVDHPTYHSISAILLDPSCSGSGIVRDIGRVIGNTHNPDSDSEERKMRLRKLQAFQSRALNKASSFPQAQLIVYSTCSVRSP